MKAISDKDFEIFVRRMAGELNFRETRMGNTVWDCDHDPLLPKTRHVLMVGLLYDSHRIAFFLQACREAKIKCDCDLMFNLDKI